MNKFDEEYYRSVNYVDYLDREDRYLRTAKEVMGLLNTLGLDKGPVLDFGCAVGHLLKGLSRVGYGAYGVDISKWAVEQCKSKNLSAMTAPQYSLSHGVTFALDVLEHMPEEEVINFLNNLDSKCIVFRIPVCLKEGEDYVLECSRNDPTHIIRWTRQQWADLFAYYNYTCLDLNLISMYNSPGVYSGLATRCDI